MYYNDVAKGEVNMDFLDRLHILMERHNDNNSTLAKKSGIPYTTIVGLFNRNWEKAQISTIQRICEFYNVSLDYMVYGAEKLSDEALIVAAKYETLSDYGKSMIEAILQNEKKYEVKVRLPVIETGHDSDVYARYYSKQEIGEFRQEESPSRVRVLD